eukprot:1218153-Alexandrium_andersonii.AAC.1
MHVSGAQGMHNHVHEQHGARHGHRHIHTNTHMCAPLAQRLEASPPLQQPGWGRRPLSLWPSCRPLLLAARGAPRSPPSLAHIHIQALLTALA